MIALNRISWVGAGIGLIAANFAGAQVETVELRLGEPIRPLETLVAERTLLRVPGVRAVRVDLRRGLLVVTPVEGHGFDPTTLTKTIGDEAFSTTHVGVTASGTLTMHAGAPILAMDGQLPRLALSGGSKIQELTGDPALAGKAIRVSGTFSRKSGGDSPTLTVEEWAVSPDLRQLDESPPERNDVARDPDRP